MRIRTLVSSTALASILLVAAAPVKQAFAQTGLVLSPSTEWAVTKVDNPSGAYCAMARRYNRDTVMTIAQNGNAETSFALDFQRTMFKTGQMVNVVLDPGAGQQRFYDIEPVSGRAFVVRLGQDKPFFEAIEKTGMLRVEAAGQSYHFSLTNFGAGQSRLDSCVAAMVMPAAGDESASGAGAPVSASPAAQAADLGGGDSGGAYRQEINALRKQIAELTRKNEEAEKRALSGDAENSAENPAAAALSEQLTNLRRENETLRGQLDAAQAQAKSSGAAPAVDEGARAAMEELRAENGRLKSELDALQKSAASSTGVAEDPLPGLEREISNLRAENQRLGEALMQATNADGKAELEKLRAQNQSLTAQIAATRQQIENEFGTRLSALEARNKELETSLAGRTDNAKILEELRGKMAALESENQALKDEASRLAAAGEQEKETALSDIRRKNDEKIAELQASVEQLRLENERKDQQILEIGKGASEVLTLREEIKTLKAQLAAAEMGNVSAEDLKARVSALEDENKALKGAVVLAETEADSVSQEKDAAVEARREIESLVAENVALADDLAAARADAGDFAALKSEIAALAAENLELEMAMAEASSSSSSSSEDLAILREENSQLQEKIGQKDLRIAELEKVEAQLAQLQAKNEAVADRGNGTEEEAKKLSEKISALEAERDKVKQELAEALEVSGQHEAEIEALKRKIETVSQTQSVSAKTPALPPSLPESRAAVQRENVAVQAVEESREGKIDSAPEAAMAMAQGDSGESSGENRPAVSDMNALNEAQRQEMEMRGNIDRQQIEAPSGAAVVAHSDAVPLSMRQTQDPFDDIEVKDVSEVTLPTKQAQSGENVADFNPAVTVPELLSKASLVEPAAVERVAKASGPDRLAYQWRDGGVYGTAEQRSMSSPANFDDMVKDYLVRAQERCPGEFAVVPDGSVDGAGGRADSYEIACVGANVSSGASLLFFDRDGTFTVVAHEAPAQELGSAIGYRDQVKKILIGS